MNCLLGGTGTFHNYTVFPFRNCCIVVTEYPVVNMPTALRLALKSTLVVVARIYAQVHSQALTSYIYVRVLILCGM